LIKSKKLLSAEKRTNFECMYIFYSLLFFFFLRVGVLFLFWTQALQAVLKEAFFSFMNVVYFGRVGPGSK